MRWSIKTEGTSYSAVKVCIMLGSTDTAHSRLIAYRHILIHGMKTFLLSSSETEDLQQVMWLTVSFDQQKYLIP